MQMTPITAQQWCGERSVYSPAEAMVATLTGVRVNLQPVYTLSGITMEGVRTEITLQQTGARSPAESRWRKRTAPVNGNLQLRSPSRMTGEPACPVIAVPPGSTGRCA